MIRFFRWLTWKFLSDFYSNKEGDGTQDLYFGSHMTKLFAEGKWWGLYSGCHLIGVMFSETKPNPWDFHTKWFPPKEWNIVPVFIRYDEER